MEYSGSCHCGAVTFRFQSEEIQSGLHCNCSICRRKGALMTNFTIAPENMLIVSGQDNLGLYQFDTRIAKHYFCKTCGIYPFHETFIKPGHFRVNLGCIDGIDPFQLPLEVHDRIND